VLRLTRREASVDEKLEELRWKERQKERECSDCDKSDGLLKRLAITSTVQTGICGRGWQEPRQINRKGLEQPGPDRPKLCSRV
jgi:hypothetical protein